MALNENILEDDNWETQQQVLATVSLFSEQKDTDLNRQPKLSHALLSIADPCSNPWVSSLP